MNLTLSKRGDYVIRSALCLARAYPSGEHRKIREVVAEMGVPHTFASQILADLVRANLATSRAGRDGGYRLSRPPEEIPLLEVVEAGEGPLRAERCALGEGPCRWDGVCPLHETWCQAVDALRTVLAGTSLAELVAEDRAIEIGAAVTPVSRHRTVPVSVPVHDTVQVEQTAADVAERFRNEGWMATRVVEAYAAAETLRGAVDPGGSPWHARSAPALRIARRRAEQPGGDVANLADQPVFEIAWEVDLPGGVTSRLEGTMALRPLDPERTELAIAGRFRLPAQPVADTGLSKQLARRTVRAFVRALAEGLERDEPPRRATA